MEGVVAITLVSDAAWDQLVLNGALHLLIDCRRAREGFLRMQADGK